jgi:hypothetical protein
MLVLFDEMNTTQVNSLPTTINESLDTLGDWYKADANFRYHSNEKVNIVGIQLRDKYAGFWKKHFAGLVKATITIEINTDHLQHPPKSR